MKLVLNLKFQVITDLVTHAGYHRLPRGYHRPAKKVNLIVRNLASFNGDFLKSEGLG